MMLAIRKCSSSMTGDRPTRGRVIEIEIGPFLIELSVTKARR